MNMKYCNHIVFIAFLSLFTSQTSHADAEDASSLSAIVAKHVAQSMDKGGNLEELHKTLMEALQTNPDSPSLNYQLARYILKTGAISDNSLIGYRYKAHIETEALTTLDKVIQEDPSYGKAYSLSGHIYTIQNKLKSAESNYSKAIETTQDIPWLSFNQALLDIKKNNMDEAAKRLNQAVITRPSKEKTAQTNVYNSAWSLIKKMALKSPQYDPNQTVRKGYSKRIAPEDIVNYLAADESNKLTFIHLTSNDTWCKPCLNNNAVIDKVAKKYYKNVNFIHVSFEPWRSVSNYRELVKTFTVKGVPHNSFYMQGKMVANQNGQIQQEALEKYIVKTLSK